MPAEPISAPTLIFPAVNQLAWDYWQSASQRGEATLAAASLACDDFSFGESEPLRLPMVHEAGFRATFLALLAEHGIRRIYCPVASVYASLQRLLAEQRLPIELLGDSPIRRQVSQYEGLMARAGRLWPLLAAVVEEQDEPGLPSLVEFAGILRQANVIHGESNDEKLAAMIAVAASAPLGDVVEIGSLMGRTAFVLLYLARRHRLGSLLTVDPWRAANALHHDSAALLASLVDEWDYDVLAEAFFVNLSPFLPSDHAHLRLPSEQAHATYAAGIPIMARNAQRVPFCGRIAILHVDGNHDYRSVRQDCELWIGHLQPGAWLILDDYQWAHGDGPRRVGDELIAHCPRRIERAFVCGKALFVKLCAETANEENQR